MHQRLTSPTRQTRPSGDGVQRTTTYDAMPRAMVVTTRAVLSDTREMLSDTFRPSVIRRQLTRMPETLPSAPGRLER